MEDPIKEKAAWEARLRNIREQIEHIESGKDLRIIAPKYSVMVDLTYRRRNEQTEIIGVTHNRMKAFALNCLRAAESETEAKIHALRFEIVRFANEQLARVSAEISAHNKGRM